ncbi:4486_t:CDS:2, partial [Funneliformis caledonium]
SMLELGKYMINGKFGCKKDVTSGKTLIRRSKELGNRSAKFNQKVDDTKARKYRSASNASTSPLKRNGYQKKSRTSSNASSASSIRPMIVSKSFSSKKTNTITMDQFRHMDGNFVGAAQSDGKN